MLDSLTNRGSRLRDSAWLRFLRRWPGAAALCVGQEYPCEHTMQAGFRLHITATAVLLLTCSCAPPPGSFDIVVASITNRPSPVHVGNKVVFDYTLKNIGTNVAPAGAYHHDLYVDGKVTSFDHATSALWPGKTSYYTMTKGYFNWQPTNEGLHRYELVIVQPGKTNRTNGEINVLP